MNVESKPSLNEVQAVEALHGHYRSVKEQLSGVIVGMEDVVEQLMVLILCRGHGILEGVPGLAKTLIVSSLASLMNLTFRRIQFTPDLMPSDITGTEVLEEDHTTGKRVFRFVKGPLFGHIVLADEINRTPPKTQSALLESMQERQVSVSGETYRLPDPFFVLATQNPIEQEGTYPLPEAQLDRFMLKVNVGYPSPANEIQIIKRATTDYRFDTQPVLSAEQIIQMQQLVRKVPVADHVYEFASQLVRRSRPRETEADDFVREMVHWGAGPRAGICLILAAKSRAILQGRHHATTEDVERMAAPVLRHRILPTFNAEAEGKTEEDIIRHLVQTTRQAIRAAA